MFDKILERLDVYHKTLIMAVLISGRFNATENTIDEAERTAEEILNRAFNV